MIRRASRTIPYDRVKRMLDICAASVGLIIAAPIIAIVSVLVVTMLGRPVFFKQDRPGLDSRLFRLYKFRTMRNLDAATGLNDDEHRLTPLGRGLRATSLDELPTLINVIKGDMSVVGPRPLLVRYLARYNSEQARRHDVRPGITGLAQASGRNSLSWEQKFTLDVKYVDNRSFYLDLKVAAMTVETVFRRKGIVALGSATMPEFEEVQE